MLILNNTLQIAALNAVVCGVLLLEYFFSVYLPWTAL